MNESEKILDELKDIREIMDRSSRFLSLSGLSGILVGLYALAGAFLSYRIIYIRFANVGIQENLNQMLLLLFIVALAVLVLSLVTIFLLTIKKAKKQNKPIWGPVSKLLLLHIFIPLIAGAILILTFVSNGYYEIICACFLLFYGLALVNASKFTRPEILSLGIVEITLGLLAAILPEYGLVLWAFGFGVLHIIYGLIFIKKESNNITK